MPLLAGITLLLSAKFSLLPVYIAIALFLLVYWKDKHQAWTVLFFSAPISALVLLLIESKSIPLTLLVLFAILATYKRPVYGVMVFLFTLLFAREWLFWQEKTMYVALLAVSALSWPRMIVKKEFELKSFDFSVLLFFGTSAITFLFHFYANHSPGIGTMFDTLGGIMAYFLIRSLTDKDATSKIGLSLAVSVIIAVLWGITHASSSRVESFFYNANPFGAYLALVTLFLASLVYVKSGWQRIIYCVSVGIALVGLKVSGSRGAIFGLLIGAGFFVCVFFRARFKANWKKVASVLAIVFCVFAVYVFTLSARWNDAGDAIQRRFTIWEPAIALIQEHPLLGLGYDNQVRIFLEKHVIEGGYTPFVHNTYLQIAADSGLIALFFFILMLILFFKMVLKSENALVLGISAGILAFLVHSLVDSLLLWPKQIYMFWLMLGLAVREIEKSSINHAHSEPHISPASF
jgi:O-antigen ligase